MMNATNPINSTNSLNFINSFNAKNAFLPKKQQEEIQETDNESSIVNHVNNSILNNINVDEIQQYAEKLGSNKLTDNELKYGLMFGRSVLVNIQA